MRGKPLLQRMRGKATVPMSTDEIMSLTRGDDRPDDPAREQRTPRRGKGEAKRPLKE